MKVIKDDVSEVEELEVPLSHLCVKPLSLWKVDSELSIGSLNLDEIEENNFQIVESMPVQDFNKLRFV